MPDDAIDHMFERYDAANAQAASLKGVEDALSVARASKQQSHAELKHTIEQLRLTRSRLSHHKTKIERCKNHFLLKHTAMQPGTWLSGGVSERIKRQQAKLSQKEMEEPRLAAGERQLRSQISALEQNMKELQAAIVLKQSSEAECSQILDAVAADYPTPALVSMREQQAVWAQAAAAERQNVESIAKVTALITRAKAAYRRAEESLHRAGSANTGAQFNNFLGGDSFGFELVEHVQQAARNQLMLEARRRVHEGAQLIELASASISSAIAQRFPEVARLREVHVPTVEQAGIGEGVLEIFGGDFGDAIAGFTAANKIGRSLGVIRQCIAIVDAQERTALAVQQSLESALRDAESVLQRITHDIASEKRNIFDALRARVHPPLLYQGHEGGTGPVTVAATVHSGGTSPPKATPVVAFAHSGPVAVATPIAVAVGVPA